MMQDEERRHCERVAFLRPIVYIRRKTDKFFRATMLNFCSSGICFQSTPPVAPGEKIYIITEESPSCAFYGKADESIVGEVMWCRKKAGAYRVGVQYVGHSAVGDAEDDGLPAAASPFAGGSGRRL